MIYLDNAATSFPKPPDVSRAMVEYTLEIGANPGRSAYESSAEAARIVFRARSLLATLFNAGDARRIVFTKNATEAVNLVLAGFLDQGDEVVTTGMEHNAVMRPLRSLRDSRGIEVRQASCDRQGRLDLDSLQSSVSGRTKLVIVNHGSNVAGTVQPLDLIRSRIGDTPLLVDAAQTAGVIDIDMARDGIDFLAFTGHKSLLGPQGTGGLAIRQGMEAGLRPLIFGGTGSNSESDMLPDVLPDKYESGTMNTVGVAGLAAALNYVTKTGIRQIQSHELALTNRLLAGLAEVPGLEIYGPGMEDTRVPVVSFGLSNADPATVGRLLAEQHGIASRVGLHCAPAAHRTLGTAPLGTVRLSPGYSTTDDEVDQAIFAVSRIARGLD